MLAIRPSMVVVFSKCILLKPSPLLLKTTCSQLFPSKPSHLSTLTTPLNSLSYGPSLQKGTKPSQIRPSSLNLLSQPNQESEQDPEGVSEDELINEDNFTRVYELSALRVPAKDCFVLESRLRGHLLNWPRIRNIARVPGDEVDEEVVSFLGGSKNESEDGGEGTDITTLERRMFGRAEGDGEELSPVLYRERLAKEFNSRGFVKFRNLAKISRPKRKGKGGKGDGKRERERNERKGKTGFAVVEVVGEEEEGEDWRGLLGDGERKRKWTGSTRLLLLDEKYTGKQMEDLPQAIKVALQEAMNEDSASIYELIKCQLTLYYDYWQMNEILEALLPKDVIVPSAFETVGHIAHLNLKEEHLLYKKHIAKVVLDKTKPKIQTVVNKIDSIQNEYRTMPLEVLAGNHSLVTMVAENGLRFHVDLATVYWNSRLATERQRIISCFTRDDVICDVFAGVGPIAISAAKIVKRVYANDLNPYAVNYLETNSVLNKLERKIKMNYAESVGDFAAEKMSSFCKVHAVFNMDGRRFINAMFASEKAQSISQVVMNLPNNALEFLGAFRGVFRGKPRNKAFNLPTIHLYGFSKAEDPEFDFHERIRIALKEVAVDVEMRRVRLVSPGKWMLYASFRLPSSVAFADTT